MKTYAKKIVRGHVSASGRLSLPAEFRKAVGLEHGGDVVVELDNREIRIRTLDDTIAEAQALSQRLLAGKRNASVDDFLTSVSIDTAAAADETSGREKEIVVPCKLLSAQMTPP